MTAAGAETILKPGFTGFPSYMLRSSIFLHLWPVPWFALTWSKPWHATQLKELATPLSTAGEWLATVVVTKSCSAYQTHGMLRGCYSLQGFPYAFPV